MYVSINKQLISFQNCCGLLFRFWQGKGEKTYSQFKCLHGPCTEYIYILTFNQFHWMLYCCSGRTCLLFVVHSKFTISRSPIFEPLCYTTCSVPIDMSISQPSSLTNFRIKSNTSTRYTGTVVAQWLRCCATNRKVAGSIPDGVIGIFHWHNPSDHTLALGSTQPLTEMITRNISWG